jgi:hypothetical protein
VIDVAESLHGGADLALIVETEQRIAAVDCEMVANSPLAMPGARSWVRN